MGGVPEPTAERGAAAEGARAVKEVAALNSTLLHPRTLARLSFLIGETSQNGLIIPQKHPGPGPDLPIHE